MSEADDQSPAALRARLEALERHNKLLGEGLRQAERIRQLWDKSVQELKATKAALQASRAFLDRVLTASPDPILAADVRGRIVLTNAAAEQLVGVPREALAGRRVLRLLARPDRRRALADFRRFPAGGRGEFAIPSPRETRLLSVKWTVLPASQGEVAQVIVAGQDVTERKRAEEELRQTNEELATLHQVSSAVTRTMELEELYWEILETVAQAIPLEQDSERGILLVEGDQLKLVAHRGEAGEFAALQETVGMGEGPCGLAARRDQIVIAEGCATDSRAAVPHDHLAIPLKARDRVVGLFCGSIPEHAVFDERRLRTFKAIGEQVGVALDNALLYEEKKALSLHDPLTGLANRRCMDLAIGKTLAKAKRYDRPLSVVMLDIDHFKRYNDTYGHPAGDQLLAEIARIVSKEIREADLAIRYGGEEFLVMLPETDLPSGQKAAERIRKAVAEHTTVTASLGVATLSLPECTLEQLIRMADQALYRAKEGGRNRVEVATAG